MKEDTPSRIALVLAVGFALILVSQAGMAYHLSVGATDSVGLSLEERANTASVGEDDWKRGIGLACAPAQEPSGDLDGLLGTLSADGFCERLLYHNRLPDGLPDHFYEDGALIDRVDDEYGQRAPQDQAFPREFVDPGTGVVYEDLQFDVVAASYVGTWGMQGKVHAPTNPSFGVYHHLQDTPLQPHSKSKACAEEGAHHPYGCGGFMIGPHVAVPNAALFAQNLSEEQSGESWEMNGWLVPTYDQTFVAFLEDKDGPVSDLRLESMVTEMKDAIALDPRALPRICGFPDQISDADRAIPQWEDPCPVVFEYAGRNPEVSTDSDDLSPDRYGNRCEGVLYACSQRSEPAWYARWVCPATPAEQVALDEVRAAGAPDPLDGGLWPVFHDRASWEGCQAAFDSTDDYVTWHFVVAPTPSKCDGGQAPGFVTSHASGVQRFLAYDLDVFSPAGSVSGLDGGVTVWGEAVAQETAQQAESELTPVRKHARVEPNYDPSSTPWLGLEDTSQQNITLPREVPLCNILDEEQERVADPWVNVLDATVRPRSLERSDRVTSSTDDNLRAGVDPAFDVGPYGTGDADQDRSNRPGPGHMVIEGHIGVYYDEDDNGAFGPILEGQTRDDSDTLHDLGAWPMQWTELPEGYGPRTGIVQALYLREATEFVWSDPLGRSALAFPDGNNVYLFLSGNMRALYKADTVVTDVVDEITQPFVDEFGADLVPVRDVWEETYPSQSLGPGASDFLSDGKVGLGRSFPDQAFENQWSFLHNCHGDGADEALDCSRDTLVTAYLFEVVSEDGSLGDAFSVPVFQPGRGDAVGFGDSTSYNFCGAETPPCIQTWYDVDALDNDPDRSLEDDASPLNRPPSFS